MEPLSMDQLRQFRAAKTCHICERSLSIDRVRDHCHLTEKYRGPAHNECNLNYRDSWMIPVAFHNLSGYDSHFIIREIAICFEGQIIPLPQTKERYISFTKKIKGSDELPARENFHSTLNDSDVSNVDYEHAGKVWKEVDIETLGEYSDLYLKTDVMLLTDVFENFRDSCLKAYGLVPAHYYATPGFTWDAMLKFTKIELELLTDVDMHLFVEQGIRGGVSQCCNRYARANNKYMSNYDRNKASKYLMYFDVNNPYGWAMMESLSYSCFKWVENGVDWNVKDDSPTGYILEADLEYPDNLHDAHKDLPLCPEHKSASGSKHTKLMTTLDSKSHYILHYRSLKQALKYGLKLTRIHRVLEFNQRPWLKSYIELNTDLRKKATHDFEKNLFKLMNNAVFGKTMENVRNHVNVKLVTHWEGRYGAEALIASPTFHRYTIFEENLVAVQVAKTEVWLNKLIYVGLCVLDLSKILVCDFHYEFMLKKDEFQAGCKLLYTDTDSLLYEVQCDDVYSMMRGNIGHFDTSDYPDANPFGMPWRNKNVIGLMKYDCNGRIMTEFVGLRSKMYSVRVDGEDRMKKVKGVKTSVMEATITFDDFTKCLNEQLIQHGTQCTIRSWEHRVHTERQVKVALSPHDDKTVLVAQ